MTDNKLYLIFLLEKGKPEMGSKFQLIHSSWHIRTSTLNNLHKSLRRFQTVILLETQIRIRYEYAKKNDEKLQI